MKVILPVAGRGSRFYPESAFLPKCVLPVRGKLIIEWALASVWHHPEDVVVIYHSDQKPLIVHTLKGLLPEATLVEQTAALAGSSHTVFQASDFWKNQEDVVVVDCDIYADSHFNTEHWYDFAGDGSVLTFRSSDPSKSYIVGQNNVVSRIIEKEVASSLAVGGIYHFRSGMELYRAIDKQIRTNRMVKGEFYLSEAVNIYLENNPNYFYFEANRFYDNGTPEDVKRFEGMSDNLTP